jgi:hypothetical protein
MNNGISCDHSIIFRAIAWWSQEKLQRSCRKQPIEQLSDTSFLPPVTHAVLLAYKWTPSKWLAHWNFQDPVAFQVPIDAPVNLGWDYSLCWSRFVYQKLSCLSQRPASMRAIQFCTICDFTLWLLTRLLVMSAIKLYAAGLILYNKKAINKTP